MKVVSVVGARPQFIKAGVVSEALLRHGGIREVLVHTGQHFDPDMSSVFFDQLRLPEPAYHLGVAGLGHAAMTARMLERIDEVIAKEKPDAILVYGDTNSTLAATLAAAKRHVPVAHVEAGVRSFNRRMPEEINRIVTDRISRWLLCPSDTAVKHLAAEGIRDSETTRVVNVGDVMYDVWLRHRRHARTTPEIEVAIGGLEGNYYLATIHREESLTATTERAPIWNIIRALETIARTTPVVMPLHPRTRQLLGERPLEYIRVLAPVGYLEMITLISQCRAVFTDSGGLQKEAYYCGKPCVTLRTETEWVELVEVGANVLVGTDPQRIFEAERAVSCSAIRVGTAALYGDGNAADRVVDVVAEPA